MIPKSIIDRIKASNLTPEGIAELFLKLDETAQQSGILSLRLDAYFDEVEDTLHNGDMIPMITFHLNPVRVRELSL
jgi:hypothetical protein